eukprot:scaffold75720_cov67-Cyclotella_meneghiniana.AAC.4
MANGETRKAVKDSTEKAVDATVTGVKRLTVGLGRGLVDFTKGTVDAILNPKSIPEKLEHCIDVVAVQPVHRTIDYFDESVEWLDSEDGMFKRRIKDAQRGAKKLKVVFAAPLRPMEFGSFVTKRYEKKEEDNMLIVKALEDNFVFSHLTESRRDKLVDAFEPIHVTKGEEIIKEGDVGDYFYVIGNGEVDFLVGGNHVGTAASGATFGELALLYQAPRAATVIAKCDCKLYRLDQEHFRRILMMQAQDEVSDVVKILKKVPYFESLGTEQLNKIAANLHVKHFRDGDVMASSHDEYYVPRFSIVQEGKVKVTDIKGGGADYKDITFKPGDFFGDAAIVSGKPIKATVTAIGDVTILVISRETFVRVVGDNIQELVQHQNDKKMLRVIPFGKRKGPAENELDLLASTIYNKKFPKGHIFFTEGQKCVPALYLVRKGKLELRSSSMATVENLLGIEITKGNVHIVEEKGYFGNDTLGNNEKGEFGMAGYTVRAIEDVEVGVLDLDAIRSVVIRREEALSKSITMENLDMIRILGAGTFGKVWLVTRKGKKDAYALKVQVKKQLIEYNQADGVIREKNIMARLDHPFIIKLVSSWKDENKLYMLLKMYQGGELQSVIHTDTRDGVPEWAARFYAANILEVIYRDLKPENVLLDSTGYTVIIDLGFAKIIKDKTYTFCGTPLYLAPEIIMQKGHDKGADLWSWGVMLFEMIVGMTPFYDGIVDQMGLFKNICKGKFEMPSQVSTYASDLLKRMLVVSQNDRLGSFAGAEMDIKNHPFFEEIDWNKLGKKELKVPFTPKIKDPLDGSNFDDYSKLEKKKEHFTPLTGREQAMFDAF